MSWGGGLGGSGRRESGGGGGSSLQTFLDRLREASQAQDGKAVAKLMSLKSMPRSIGQQLIARDGDHDSLVRSGRFRPDMKVLLPDFLRSVELITRGNLLEAIDCYSGLYGTFTQYAVQQEEYDWLIPILKRMSNDLRLMAIVQDRKQVSTADSTDSTALSSSVDMVVPKLQARYRDLNKPSVMDKMRPVILFIVCQLLKCYFKLKKLKLCKPLVQNIMDNKFPIFDDEGNVLDDLSPGDAVTYMFFRGRLYLLEGNYENANTCLSSALRFCDPQAHNHKQAILAYLIPVKLNLGQLPPANFLARYRLPEYGPLIKAIREGNVALYEEELFNHQDTFIMRGTYLILEKLKFFAYRNFFKKVYLLKNSSPRLDIKTCFRLLQTLQPDTDIDLDEVECILANLIYRNYIKAYISHKDSMVVLSKTQPFPPIIQGKGFGYQ